uniref:COesterase domain-containing protein n=1 Tax=Globodera pallida TaxID=36090 RepID=A0A183C3S8_GLOPA
MRLAEELKCFNRRPSANTFMDESLQVLRCIQEHSEQNVSTAAHRVASASPTFLSAFAPIVDGQIVPNHPHVLFNAQYGALFRDIDLMAGTVLNPAHHLLANEDLVNGMSVEKRDKMLRTFVRNIFDFHRTEILQAILNKYTDWENPKDHPKSVRNGLMAALGDLLFTTPLIETLRAHSINEPISSVSDEKKSANTFL